VAMAVVEMALVAISAHATKPSKYASAHIGKKLGTAGFFAAPHNPTFPQAKARETMIHYVHMDFSHYTTQSLDEIAKAFRTDPLQGIGSKEAARRALQYGRNTLEESTVTWWHILVRQFKSPFVYLLAGAALLALILGEGIDAAMIGGFIALNSFLGFYQEYRSEKTIELLRRYTVTRARVLRDGSEISIDATLLVPGDTIILKAGDIVPADVRFIRATSLTIDESMLTGETIPIQKTESPLKESVHEYHKAANIGFSGTTIMSGQGMAIIVGIGAKSAVGTIAHLAHETPHASAFEAELGRLSSFILKLVVLTLIFIFASNLLLKAGETGRVVELIIFSIALAVSVVPEALPLVTTFSLSRGAMRLAKEKVVVKRLSAIEDLGSIEVLCTDKTGTLTENKLRVKNMFGSRDNEAILYANLAGVREDGRAADPNNAFDLAVRTALPPALRELVSKAVVRGEVPFDPDRRLNSVLVERGGNRELIIRGAPEAILARIATPEKFDRDAFFAWVAQEGMSGRRVIAIGSKPFSRTTHTVADELKGFSLVGCISFEDTVKKTTRSAIEKAAHLGVAVKILTGDSPEVAGSVAKEIGLITSVTQVISGDAFAALSLADRRVVVHAASVFARVSPEQKYEIISLLEEKKRVGFLGEGINDAPALKAAHVAIAVDGAADIAREAADIVLTQRSLNAIIDGIEEGRRVFANTVKYIKATLASNFGNFYAVAIASLFIPFLPMLPIQILLVNLLSDFPMIAIATDTVDPKELRRPNGYHIKEIALMATFLGLVSTTFDFLIFGMFFQDGESVLQTNWFIASILTELAFLFSIRSKLPFFRAALPSPTVIFLSSAAALATITLPFTSIGQNVFHFISPTSTDLALILGVVVVYFAVTESVKLFYYRTIGRGTANA